jgi:hypothetical protein
MEEFVHGHKLGELINQVDLVAAFAIYTSRAPQHLRITWGGRDPLRHVLKVNWRVGQGPNVLDRHPNGRS